VAIVATYVTSTGSRNGAHHEGVDAVRSTASFARWAAAEAVSAALEAAGARLKEKERLEARAEAVGARMPVRPVEEKPPYLGVFAKSGVGWLSGC
jgi:hypothetical protein